MKVTFFKQSHTDYELRCERPDGGEAKVILNARSFLTHDLVHFAFESQLKRTQSFYGRISGGGALPSSEPFAGELAMTEMIVGPIQTAVKQGRSGQDVYDGLVAYIHAQQLALPADVNAAVIDGVIAWVQSTLRRFEKLKTGGCLTFDFEG